jgi:hypothetical protein
LFAFTLISLSKFASHSSAQNSNSLTSHKQGILDILNCSPEKPSIAAALQTWDAFEFERETAKRGMCAVVLRTFDEWETHPQRDALKGVPPLEIIKRGEAPKREVGIEENSSGLNGVKVLDLTRVLAGPICGRTLAGSYSSQFASFSLVRKLVYIAYGADVTWITSPELPSLPLVDADTSRGKRSLHLDLTTSEDCERLREEVKESDVFLQAYRPGGLAAKGFGVAKLIEMRPGIVCANITAYGYEGPWKDRRGVSSSSQSPSRLANSSGSVRLVSANSYRNSVR